MNEYLLSLCIPTNGIVEWVIPVVEKIYSQGVDEKLFEVVITDNGIESKLEPELKPFFENHSNLVYKRTKDFEFLNQITCFKTAKGEFIKFINHRSLLEDGAIEYLLEFVRQNIKEKPVTYFSTGVLKLPEMINFYPDFDSFVLNLGYHSSWSTGLSMWKSDLEQIPTDLVFNKFFPHTTFLFFFRKNRKFCINNKILMHDIYVDQSKKGKYNLFYDFAVEYPSIICELFRKGDIKAGTFLSVKKRIKVFLFTLIRDYIVFKKNCSYDLSGWKEQFLFYFSKNELRIIFVKAFFSFPIKWWTGFKKIIKKIIRYTK